jgi:phosphoglycerate dehydrogenase-like enzyme
LTVVHCQVGEGAARRINEAFPEVEVTLEGPGEVLLTSVMVGDALPDALPGKRWIHTLGTGVDRFPLDLIGPDQVLTCSRGAGAEPISEWVISQLLAFEKRLPESWIHEPPEHWNLARLGTLDGAHVGLVGLGGIGSRVAERALPFGTEVRALRRRDLPSPVPGVEVVTDLLELVGWADHLVLTAPGTPATRYLIDADVLAAAKPGLHLVNIARGSLVDQDALREALDDERVALASLDTVEPEPLPDGHWLYTHPRVHLSAHISWSAPGALDRLLDAFLEDLARWEAGEPLQYLVDLEAGY